LKPRPLAVYDRTVFPVFRYMKTMNLNHRMKSAVNGFFDPPGELCNSALSAYAWGDVAPRQEEVSPADQVSRWLITSLRVLMFGPGTFALFYMTLTAVFYYPSVSPRPISYLLAIFCVYAGSGRLRHLINLAVPAAVIAMAATSVTASWLFFGRELTDLYFWDSIYLLPAVLTTAKLVQIAVAERK